MRKIWLAAQGISMAAAVAATAWTVPGMAPSDSGQSTTLSTNTVAPAQLVTDSQALPPTRVVPRSAGDRTVYARFVVPTVSAAGPAVTGNVQLRAGAATPFLVAAPVVSGDPIMGSPTQLRLGHPLSASLARPQDQRDTSAAVTGSLLAHGSFWVAVRLSAAAPAPVRASWRIERPQVTLSVSHRLPPHPNRTAASSRPAPGHSPRPQPPPSGSPKPSPSPTQPAPASGTLFGSTVQPIGNETAGQAVARLRAQLGPLGALRVFSPGTAKSWPSIMGLTGSAPAIVSFKESPKAVLSGALDSYYRAWFAAAPRDHVDYWTFWHEPEDDMARGAFTSADYRGAWTHLKALADQAHNPELKSTLILMGWTVEKNSGRNFADYYAGSSVIDVLGWDTYNHGWTKGIYSDPAGMYGDQIAFSAKLGKPFGIAETGSILAGADKGLGRAAWLTAVGHYLRPQHALFVTYFNSDVGVDYRLLDVPSQQAWRSIVMGG